jgi:hypothetical protein
MDILEHVAEPQKMLEVADCFLKENGFFAVSVPTPNYPKIFSRKFHNRIGHLVDGYSIQQLDRLFIGSLGFNRILHSYNTGLLSNIGCWLYYNIFGACNKYLNFLNLIMLYPLLGADWYNSSAESCTLFAVYRKRGASGKG